eukprot:2345625-Pyramimonas_sp.AAC.1
MAEYSARGFGDEFGVAVIPAHDASANGQFRSRKVCIYFAWFSMWSQRASRSLLRWATCRAPA